MSSNRDYQSRANRIIASLIGGLIAGIFLGLISFLLVDANEAASTFKLWLIGSGFLGILDGPGYRRLHLGKTGGAFYSIARGEGRLRHAFRGKGREALSPPR